MPTAAPPQDGALLRREFTLWSSFAFAFAFISPIVALYGIFGLAISTAGPGFWWAFPLVFAGQLLVALVFGMLVSRWPLEGSVYQWSRGLLGTAYGWFAGWAYLWTLVCAMATVALGAATFLAQIVGLDEPTGTQQALIALVVLLAGTAVNVVGRGALKVLMTASIAAELIGSVGLGTWLLLFHRHQPLSVFVHGLGAGAPGGGPGYLALGGPFLVAVLFVGFSFVGFESAGAIAEEVSDPRRALPRAIITSLTLIAVVVMYASLAIILAIPDLGPVVSGQDGDPVTSTLTSQLGAGVAKPVEVLFVIGFLASFLALQTSASRVIWSYARDGALPGAHVLRRLSPRTAQPTAALLVTTVVGAALFLFSTVATDFYTLMITFTSGGFFVAFCFPLIGALVVQLRGRWQPGPFTLGRLALPITTAAVVWAVFELLDIAWPRRVNDHRWLDWSVPIAVAALAVVGALVFAGVRSRIQAAPLPEVDDDLGAPERVRR